MRALCRWVLCVALCAASCKREDDVLSVSPGSAATPAQRAAIYFRARCASCHGERGAGDGPAAAGLTPRPRNFSDPMWAAGITDAHLRRVIVSGGASAGKSPLMPPFGELDSQPALRDALVAHVRRLMDR